MKKILLVLSFGLVSFLTAETLEDPFKIRVGGYFITHGETVSNVSSLNIGGKEISFHKDLDMDEVANTFRLDGEYRFNDFHKVELSYYRINSNGTNSFSEDIPYKGKTYHTNVILDAYLNMDIFKINYAYSFYKDDKFELAAAIGLHMLDIDLGTGGTVAVDNLQIGIPETSIYTVLAPLPVVGFRLNYTLSPELNLYGNFDYFGATISKYSGSLSDFVIGAEYQVYENFGIGLGWNMSNLDLDIDDDDEIYLIDHDISGLLVYISYSF